MQPCKSRSPQKVSSNRVSVLYLCAELFDFLSASFMYFPFWLIFIWIIIQNFNIIDKL